MWGCFTSEGETITIRVGLSRETYRPCFPTEESLLPCQSEAITEITPFLPSEETRIPSERKADKTEPCFTSEENHTLEASEAGQYVSLAILQLFTSSHSNFIHASRMKNNAMLGIWKSEIIWVVESFNQHVNFQILYSKFLWVFNY